MKVETQLKLALRNGSQERINVLFERIYNSFFNLGLFVSRQYLDEYDAKEVVNDVFVSFFEKVLKEKTCSINNIKQYLCSSIKNASIKEFKRTNKQVIFDDNVQYVDEIISYSCDQLLKELKPLEQHIIIEHVLMDRTFKDIGKDISMPTNTVKSIYRRGCQKARRGLTWAKEK